MRIFKLAMLGVSLALLWVAQAMAQPPYPQAYLPDFPQHKSCNMVQVMNFPDNKTAVLDCGKTPAQDVYDFYLGKAKKAGWEVLIENKTLSDFMLFMAEKDARTMQVQVLIDNGYTNLSLSLVQE